MRIQTAASNYWQASRNTRAKQAQRRAEQAHRQRDRERLQRDAARAARPTQPRGKGGRTRQSRRVGR